MRRGKTRRRRATQTHIAGTEERKKLPMHLYSVPSIIHVVPRPTRGNFAFRNPCKTIRRNCERCTTRSNAQQPPPLIFLARIHFCAQKRYVSCTSADRYLPHSHHSPRVRSGRAFFGFESFFCETNNSPFHLPALHNFFLPARRKRPQPAYKGSREELFENKRVKQQIS